MPAPYVDPDLLPTLSIKKFSLHIFGIFLRVVREKGGEGGGEESVRRRRKHTLLLCHGTQGLLWIQHRSCHEVPSAFL